MANTLKSQTRNVALWNGRAFVVLQESEGRQHYFHGAMVGPVGMSVGTALSTLDAAFKRVVKRAKVKLHEPIPSDYEVRPVRKNKDRKGIATCGHCNLSWDDNKATSMTPTPSGRCPFEAFHLYDEWNYDDVIAEMEKAGFEHILAAEWWEHKAPQ